MAKALLLGVDGNVVQQMVVPYSQDSIKLAVAPNMDLSHISEGRGNEVPELVVTARVREFRRQFSTERGVLIYEERA